MPYTYTKTTAIRAARRAISQPSGSRTDWRVYGPYYPGAAGLTGPTTEAHYDNYAAARACRTRWIASTALSLMGMSAENAEAATYDATGSVEQIVSTALAKARGEAPE